MDMKQQGTGAGQAQEPTINAGNEPKDPQDVALFVQTLLQQVQDKFQTMSDQILNRIDEMGGRIDELEHNLNELMQQAGVQQPIDDAGSSVHSSTNPTAADNQDVKK